MERRQESKIRKQRNKYYSLFVRLKLIANIYYRNSRTLRNGTLFIISPPIIVAWPGRTFTCI